MKNQVICGNNIEVLKGMPDNSVDSIVTDPPYGLSFMNKHWDYEVPKVELWKECLRVLKPGGYLLSFAGTRTYHRMAVNIEDAGFEIRDMISWIYGSGFPKSLDIGKAIDKIQGNEREVIGKKNGTYADIKRDKETGQDGLHGGVATERPRVEVIETKGNSEYEGWGTALKPACEPICVARKPIPTTVAENVLKYGTGGLNIDGCRVSLNGEKQPGGSGHMMYKNNAFNPVLSNHSRSKESAKSKGKYGDSSAQETHQTEGQKLGRFPANIIFDEISSVLLDEMSGESKSTGGKGQKSMGAMGKNGKYGTYSLDKLGANAGGLGDSGGASRFFYCAKSSKAERNGGLEGFEPEIHSDRNAVENIGANNPRNRTGTAKSNHHPTVKPLKLMQYLVRLVTPKGGVCIDPFCGSGTTLMACVKEGFDYIGLEREAEYVKIAEARIEWVKKEVEKIKLSEPSLFDED